MARSRVKRIADFSAVALAIASPLALLIAALLLRYVGESWWVTSVALYLPRIGFAPPIVLASALIIATKRWRRLWTQLVALLVLLFPLMGLTVSWPWPARSGPVLRVMSYNTQALGAGPEAIADEVLSYDADVVFLQEAADDPRLLDRLRTRYPVVEVTGQFVLASRYPARVSRPPKFTLRGAEHDPRYTRQVIDTPLGSIVFYSAHPVSPRHALIAVRGHGIPREVFSGRLVGGAASSRVDENSELRRLELETTATAARSESGPVVIAGDTNLPGLSPIFVQNFGRYQDAFAETGFGFGYTFPTNRTPWMRLDRIMANDELKFVGFTVGCGKLSDHRCVIAEIERR